MGCFDSVWVKCPKCGREREFQTKIGESLCHKYDEDKVPLVIALGVEGEVDQCRDCKTRFKVSILNRPAFFQVNGEIVKDDQDEDFVDDKNW